MKKYFFLFLMFAHFGSRAEDTNTVYPIDDGMLVTQNSKGQIKFDQSKVETAKQLGECLPVSEFPEGNWGAISGGFQVSLRFETNKFTAGSSILASVIVRNVTNAVLTYRSVGILGRTSPISIVLTDASGASLPPKPTDITVVSLRDVKLFPGTEQKFHERIDNLYNLPTNCLMNACAQLQAGTGNTVQVQSAMVPIIIR
jgi:hypothetical protein